MQLLEGHILLRLHRRLRLALGCGHVPRISARRANGPQKDAALLYGIKGNRHAQLLIEKYGEANGQSGRARARLDVFT